MGFGVNIWTYVYGRIRGLEDRQVGWKEVASGGFGDDENTWIWSQNWYNGKLYVGTGRSINCDIDYTAAVSTNFPLYPPPGNACPLDGLDLASSAQIWQYTPQTHTWLMVYESPRDVSLGPKRQ